MPRLEVLRTYLEMTDPGQLTPAADPHSEARLERLGQCPASFYRYLYAEVGRRYHWVDRLPWSDDRIRGHLADPVIGPLGLRARGRCVCRSAGPGILEPRLLTTDPWAPRSVPG